MNRGSARTWSLVVVVLVAVLAGCATPAPPLPPARMLQAGDLKSLAGEWEGSAKGTAGQGAYGGPGLSATVVVKEDGTFTSNMGGITGVGTWQIVNGKVSYEGSTMRGIGTLYGSGAQEVFKGEGTVTGMVGQSSVELRRKR
jgi:hypothetical protein